jgi:butyrate response factor 1
MGKESEKENISQKNTKKIIKEKVHHQKKKLNKANKDHSNVSMFLQKINGKEYTDLSNELNPKVFMESAKPRKNSNDSEGFSTSNEDNQEKEINTKIKKTGKIGKETQKKKEPYKTKPSDFKKKYKTELCKYFEIRGYCKYGDNCAYAHGKENLRLKVTNTSAYRTKKCTQFFEKGYCPYGNRCQFAHQLESNIINNPFDKKMSYSKILETFSKIESLENIENIIEKPRLQVFKDIVNIKENIPSRLFDDVKKLA